MQWSFTGVAPCHQTLYNMMPGAAVWADSGLFFRSPCNQSVLYGDCSSLLHSDLSCLDGCCDLIQLCPGSGMSACMHTCVSVCVRVFPTVHNVTQRMHRVIWLIDLLAAHLTPYLHTPPLSQSSCRRCKHIIMVAHISSLCPLSMGRAI